MRDIAEINAQMIQDAEDKIRINAATKGIRVKDVFQDFDRLRSGYISRTQFKRVLNQHFKVILSIDEENLLLDKYNLKNDDTICYREFCQAIDQSFPANDVSTNPEQHASINPEYLGTFRSTRILDEQNMGKVENLLRYLSNYFSKNGIDVLTNFHDFDRSHTGIVTESQFYRGLSEPKLTPDQLELLVNKYKDPEKPGKVNYMNMHYDIKSFEKMSKSSDEKIFKETAIYSQPDNSLSIQEILDKILIAAHKNGIRISDFFKDYDKLRSGVVTEHQFVCALSLAIEKQANLSRNDISKLVEYYRQPDGRCYYKTFTDQIENAFMIPDLEKKPTVVPRKPRQGILGKNIQYFTLNSNLSPYDEEIIQQTLDVISEKVHKRRLQVFPYFKDYDRSKAYSRGISKHQFGRVLSMLDLMPTANEFRLLCEKFEDRTSGDIYYPAFCHCVDDEYFASSVDAEVEVVLEDIPRKIPEQLPPDITTINMNDLLARIRNHVLSNRIRIKEFFEDMDPLRSSKMSKTRFVRCLNSIGISSIGLYLNKAQIYALLKKYEDPVETEKVNWKNFENDIESVFTMKDIEKDPNVRVPPSEIFEMPPAGTVNFLHADKFNENDYSCVMEKWKRKILQRRLDCWPPFKDFDRHNRGHVTNTQYRQSLAILELPATEAEAVAVAAKFMDDMGFNYIRFLNELQPTIVEEPKYSKFQQELSDLNANKVLTEYRPAVTVQGVLKKVKEMVLKKRCRIYEWLRDHDKLNSGRLPKDTFRRALDLCNFELKEAEYALLEDYYRSSKERNAVEYRKFCTEIESIFTDDQLEKNPLIDPEQYKLEKTLARNKLAPNDEEMVVKSLKRIADRVKRYRIQLFPKFEDFDRVKNGFVSNNQFRRVLNDLDLASLLNEIEYKKLAEKFQIQIGTRDDIDYVTFADVIYSMGGFEYRQT